jgi:asparagine synthase (glutamine-hydrolysing)
MRHRGPDGCGIEIGGEGRPTLEHCRLAIIDPQNREADQPFRDASGRFTIVYNGELFNYRELRRELEARGVRFRTESDTEVLVNVLAVEGLKALPRLRGMFAFVLWDDAKRELLAARDHVGVKPLYYSVAEGTFVAASELRTLIAHPAIRPALDPAGVVEYLSFGFVTGSRTLLEGIFKLPPAHALQVRDGTVRTSEYWDVLPAYDEAHARNGRDPALDLTAQLEDAVAASLVSDVPVSLMLSGGLDSSAIAALATRHVPAQDLTAYSVSFGRVTDESPAAARLAEELGLHHREIRLTRDALAEGFDDWLHGLDVPTANPTWTAISAIACSVREDGVKVLLSGDGGDELFGGYNRWMKYLRFDDRVWSRTPALARRIVGSAARPFVRGLAADIARRAREGGELFVGSRPFHDDDLRRCLGRVGRDVARDTPPETGVVEIHRRFEERHPDGDQLARMSYIALKTDLVEDYLVRLDSMAMAASVEGRVPLLDVGLARFAFSLSQIEKIGPSYEQKALFRRAVSAFLPSYITARPKQGFCPPVADWAATLLPSRIPCESVLVDGGLVAPDAMSRLAEARSQKASFALWALGTLAVWCETNL